MGREVEFLFDYVSPTSYLAWARLPVLARRAEATIRWTPVFLGGIMQATGNRPPGAVEAKARWMARDLARFAARYGAPFAMNPAFPMNTLMALRGALVAAEDGWIERYSELVFPAVWAHGVDVSSREALARLLADEGADAEALLARAGSEEIKARLKANTEQAVARGAFGCPSFFVAGELHFGQDRLDFVEEALCL